MDPVGILIIVVAVAISCVLSFFIAKSGSRAALGVVWGLWFLVTAFMLMLTYTTPGWDALAYLIVLLFGCAPAGVGLLIGSVAGYMQRA